MSAGHSVDQHADHFRPDGARGHHHHRPYQWEYNDHSRNHDHHICDDDDDHDDPERSRGADRPMGRAGQLRRVRRDHATRVLIPGTSKILFFEDGAGTYVLDTETGAFAAETAGNNLFCAGQTVLADGRIMTLGGDLNGEPEAGLVNTNIYNPATNSWTATAPMHYLRWYPTATKLPDGRILATSGTASGVVQQIPEVYDPASNTWTALPSATDFIPSYPFMFVLPDGRVVQVGSFTAPTDVQVLNPANWTWSTVDPSVTDAGSAVMYQPGKILRAGSSGFPGTARRLRARPRTCST